MDALSSLHIERAAPTHPIRSLFDYGVPVTVNSDDMLIFGSGVSQEYRKLYQAGVFGCEELEQIRIQGLSAARSL